MDLDFNFYYVVAGEPSKFFTTTNFLYLLNTCITAAVGIWLGVSFKKNYESTRSVKDHFISQSNSISKEYASFLESLCKGESSCVDVQSWFKKMSLKIKDFEKFLCIEFKVSPDILKKHNALKKYLTNTEIFNQSFSKEKLVLNTDTKNMVDAKYNAISNSLIQLTINIIKARKCSHWKKKTKY